MKKTSILITALALVILFVFTGCSGSKVEAKLIIDGEETVCQAKTKETIGKILENNGVTLGEKDEVEPTVDTVLGEETTEIRIYRNKTITIKADGKTTTVELTKGTVADALAKAEIKLGKNDKPSIDAEEKITDGMEIEVIRGISVTVTLKGQKKAYVTTKATVEEALKELKIDVDKDDIVEPSKDTKIKKGLAITVKKVEVKEETETEVVYYSTVEDYSSSMAEGTSEITQYGQNGEKNVVYKNTYVDGELTDSEVLSEEITVEPVNEVIVYGTMVVTTTQATTTASSGREIVSKERFEDCDGSGHGYYAITYSDGTVEYVEF